MFVKEITAFLACACHCNIYNTGVWLYTQGCGTLFGLLVSHSLTIYFCVLFLASTASAPYPPSFSESKGRGHQTVVPGFHVSF